MTDKNLPPNFYLASYLKKAGIRFEVNVVDTVIAKGLGIGSYIIVLLLLFFNCSGLFKISLNNFYFVAVNLLGVLYLLYVFDTAPPEVRHPVLRPAGLSDGLTRDFRFWKAAG